MTVKAPTRPNLLEYNATLVERINLTDKLALFRVRPDDGDGFPGGAIPNFAPGQYAVLGLNNELSPERGKTSRAYSIASPPEEKSYLEFYIRFVDEPASDNPLTHLLWRAKSGDRIHLRPAITGKFTIGDTVGDSDPRIKILVAAGTGLAPFFSMAMSRLAIPRFSDRLVILHGSSYPRDLGYQHELAALQARHPERLFYFPTISRPKESPNWNGHTGRVESFFEPTRVAELEDRLAISRGGLNPQNAVVYICGLVGTIQVTLERCLKLGFIPENRRARRALGFDSEPASLFFEQYDSTPIVDPADSARITAMLDGTPWSGRVKPR